MDYVYVAMFDGLPVAVSKTILSIEDMLSEYTKGTMVKYDAWNPKYPDDLQGFYTYKTEEGDEVQFKLYTVDYK